MVVELMRMDGDRLRSAPILGAGEQSPYAPIKAKVRFEGESGVPLTAFYPCSPDRGTSSTSVPVFTDRDTFPQIPIKGKVAFSG